MIYSLFKEYPSLIFSFMIESFIDFIFYVIDN